MDYFSTDGRRIRIIGQYYVNGSVQLNGVLEVWISSLLYISNATITDTNRGWGWTGTAINSTISTATVIWGTPINTSTANSPRIPVIYCVARSRNRDEFLQCRRLENLWRLYKLSDDEHS